MSFISFEFIILFVCCFLLYCLAGNKGRKYILLVASSVFIGYYHPMFLVTALLVSLLSYYAGQCIEKVRLSGHARTAYAVTVLLLVGGWIVFRYADKLSGNGSWLFPLGISFYTFQAISYLTEIYWEEEKPEKNLTDFLLYMLSVYFVDIFLIQIVFAFCRCWGVETVHAIVPPGNNDIYR